MTFKIYAVELSNFKCYYGDHLWELPQEPGLYYLTGRNEYNNRLGANAVGKSSLIDAIEWCLYGKTSRGLRAGDVIAWGKKSCKVSVSLQLGEKEVEIVRTQSPNTLAINGTPASQDEVTAELRLNQEAFACAVILPQFGESFFDLTPTKKLEMFSQVMDLDYWLEKSKRADGKAASVASTIHRLELSYDKEGNRLENSQDNLRSYRKKADEHDARTADTVVALKQEIKRAERSIDKANAQIDKVQKRLKKVDKEAKQIKEGIIELGDLFEKAGVKRSDAQADMKTLDRHFREINADLKDLEGKVGTVCPECQQKIDPKHLKGQRKALEKKRDRIADEYRKAGLAFEKAEKEWGGLRSDIVEVRKLDDEVLGEQYKLSNELKSHNRSLIAAEDSIKHFSNEIYNAENKPNPFADMIEAAKADIKASKKSLKRLRSELDEQLEKHSAYSYWVNGFKRVRLFVLEEALHGLEIEVNNLLINLGLIDWKITFDVERENKSGGITKGFSVFITSPKHDKPVRFESWSGGESQRLKLAGDLGLANLIMEQAGFENHIEIIDEPSEHMSPEGIADLVDTIRHRAESSSKQVWLVDHHTMDVGDFAGVLIAKMNSEGKAELEYRG